MKKAFTLAELLIALGILGVIATFTIPKILDSGSDSKFNSIAKEAISMVSGAYQSYKLENTASASTSFPDLTPYINFVSLSTTLSIDGRQNEGIQPCGPHACIILHNGAAIFYATAGAQVNFGSTATTSAFAYDVDPDGKVTTTGAAGTPGKSVSMWLYYNGRTTNRGNIPANSYVGTVGPVGPDSALDPPWFSWSN